MRVSATKFWFQVAVGIVDVVDFILHSTLGTENR